MSVFNHRKFIQASTFVIFVFGLSDDRPPLKGNLNPGVADYVYGNSFNCVPVITE